MPKTDRPSPNASVSPDAQAGAATTGQTLTAPVTVNADTAADGVTVTQSGAGRAVSGAVTSGSNGLSAVKDVTPGSGSGVNGVNSGTIGLAGKFEIANGSSNQPSVLATTMGNGTAASACGAAASSTASA